MDESINKKNIISVSRNKPVAFVVGAAGFLGSHLVDKLLSKGIQVIGLDDLKNGQRDNLKDATQSKDFHLIIESPDSFNLEPERLDYIFIAAECDYELKKVLELFKKFKCRLLLFSTIALYEKEAGSQLTYKHLETRVADFVSGNKLNARVLRLGPVFGPRMEFNEKDPIIKLIRQVLTGQLQKDIPLDFSSRAIFVEDAVELAIRTIFAGSTAQKIFDGVAAPVKISEVRQVLLDPVWYEQRDFKFTQLPPWPSPNLEKTKKFLNWYPTHKTLKSLRETISYFKDNEIDIPKDVNGEPPGIPAEQPKSWDKDKKEALNAFKKQGTEPRKPGEIKKGPSFSLPAKKIFLIFLLALVSYALIWPSFVLGWGVLAFRYQLSDGLKKLQSGELESSLSSIETAAEGVQEVKVIFESLDPVRKLGLFKDQFQAGEDLINLSVYAASSARSSVLGIEALLQSIKAITGERDDSPGGYIDLASAELASASNDIAKANAIIKSDTLKSKLPLFVQDSLAAFSQKLDLYSKEINQAKSLSILLPKLVALDGKKDYLVLLQNNMELRPAGGFIGSFAKVSFEGGKLKTLEVNDIYSIDGNLGINVAPPKEIKEDLGQNNWYLRDSNWEADFPTSARQAEWFYTKETGETVDGVVALDVSAMEALLEVTGPLEIGDYKEVITSENLFAKAVSHAEMSFFPGSQAKKSFLTALANGIFEKMFFLPQNNWTAIIGALGRSLEEKHISIYFNDPKIFSYLMSQNWAHQIPRQSDENKNRDFLSLVEANLGANKANYYLDRSYSLETEVGKSGEVEHRLRITYINKSPAETFPGGKYKNRMRAYLPLSSKLTKVSWGESEITQTVETFVDYGRSGYSFLIELGPKEQKTLILDYTVPVRIEFKDGKAEYKLDVIKQAGLLNDPFRWTISYPISYKLVSETTESLGPQEETISTDLSRDRSFLLEFEQ